MTPLVLVHGFLGGGAQWAGLAEVFGDRTEVVPVDLPGFGANAQLSPLNSIEGYAEWVILHLRNRGAERYHLLGHSMGGMIAQEMARRDATNVCQLVLYATGARGVLPGRFETIAESKRRAETDGPRATARRIAATWFRDGDSAAGFDTCARIAEQAGLDAIHAGLNAMEAWSGEQALSEITQDALIIWGDMDRSYTHDQVAQLTDRIPKSKLEIIPGCAHAAHLENPDVVWQSILRHLNAHNTD